MKVYYWKDISWLTFFDFNFESQEDEEKPKSICFSKRIFDAEWVEMPIELDDKSNVFGILNNDDNPLSTPHFQSWIREHGLHHTSMSVGDIIQKADGYFVCMPFGWRKIIWCER